MTASAVGARPAGTPDPGSAGSADDPAATQRPLLTTGALAAAAVVTGTGLAAVTMLVLIGWIAAPHAGTGLPAVLRTAAALWLVGQHVGFTFRGAGRIGLLPLGLVVLPGALLWRAGRLVVRAGQVRRLRHVGYAAICARRALRGADRSAGAGQQVRRRVVVGPAGRDVRPAARVRSGGPRRRQGARSLVAADPAAAAATAIRRRRRGRRARHARRGRSAAGRSLADRPSARGGTLQRDLAPGAIGTVLLLLLQLGYLPNAVIWAIAFSLGPGFAFGAGTVVAPTGSALTQLPALPMLAALPPGLHGAMPGWIEPTVLALPYLAGGLGGLLLVRAAPALALDAAPLWGLACGALSGVLLGLLAAASGGPLGDGRLSAVGPSAWQIGAVSALEIGVAAAVTAGAGELCRPAPGRGAAADVGHCGCVARRGRPHPGATRPCGRRSARQRGRGCGPDGRRRRGLGTRDLRGPVGRRPAGAAARPGWPLGTPLIRHSPNSALPQSALFQSAPR